MSERPTPETDAFVAALKGEWDEQFVELMAFAKKLERERDAMKKMINGLKLFANERYDEIQRVRKERDEARERERVAITSWDEERQRSIRESDRVLKAIRERNEAREAFAVATDQLFKEQSDHRMVVNSYCAVVKERNQLRRALAMVSEDCLAWLNSESDEPSVEFIKAVQKFAHKESNAPLQEAAK